MARKFEHLRQGHWQHHGRRAQPNFARRSTETSGRATDTNDGSSAAGTVETSRLGRGGGRGRHDITSRRRMSYMPSNTKNCCPQVALTAEEQSWLSSSHCWNAHQLLLAVAGSCCSNCFKSQ